ncbi:MAG: PAS domain S-box protein [Methylocystaceae bacterium]
MQDLPYIMSVNNEEDYVASSLGRLAEALLVTNPRTYRQLMSYSNIGYYLIQNGSFILVSPGLAKMLDYTMEELMDVRPLDLVISKDRDMVCNLTDAEAWEKMRTCRCICRLMAKDGKEVAVQLENMPIIMAAQQAHHGLVINLYDLVSPDDELRQTLELFDAIINSVNDGLAICDYVSGRITEVNQKIAEIFGYRKDEITQLNLYHLWHSEGEYGQNSLMSVIKQVRNVGPQIVNWPLYRKNKTLIWVNANLRYTVIRGREVILITLRDVTDLLSVTNQLRQSEERFKLAASLASDLIYEENTAVGELYWYGDIDKLLGYAPGTFPRTTRAWKQAIDPDLLPSVQQEIDRCTGMDNHFQLEYRVKKQDGNWIWISERGKNVVDNTGKIIRCIGTITDVSKLKQVYKSLEASEERFRLLTENARDIIFSIQIKPELKVFYMSPALTWITGYLPEEFYINPELLRQRIEPQHQGLTGRIIEKEVNFNSTWRASWRRKDSSVIWTEQNAIVIHELDKVIIQGVARDITETRRLEEKMMYMATHDALTGLMNRQSFEEHLNQIVEDTISWSLIVIDLDGLKLINDTMGHQVGDFLLKATGEIIKEACANNRIYARIGGDEFAMLLADNNITVVSDIINSVKQLVNKFNHLNNTYLSLSIGYAISGSEGVTNANLFKEADNNMYRYKLLNSQSIRSSIIRGLSYTLRARDFQTEGHGERIQNLILQLARAVPLADNRLNDLVLLAQFHDIGKVGIPDHILFKTGALDEREFETMKRHSEIGYRIAQSVPDLATVSDWILKHHEWWNGEGYPLGLKGEQIPIECRILSIVDAYDAMINNRPYRKAMSSQQAIAELEKWAGKQFDPDLVPLFISIIKQNEL